mgnify:CR=1 FL=1
MIQASSSTLSLYNPGSSFVRKGPEASGANWGSTRYLKGSQVCNPRCRYISYRVTPRNPDKNQERNPRSRKGLVHAWATIRCPVIQDVTYLCHVWSRNSLSLGPVRSSSEPPTIVPSPWDLLVLCLIFCAVLVFRLHGWPFLDVFFLCAGDG